MRRAVRDVDDIVREGSRTLPTREEEAEALAAALDALSVRLRWYMRRSKSPAKARAQRLVMRAMELCVAMLELSGEDIVGEIRANFLKDAEIPWAGKRATSQSPLPSQIALLKSALDGGYCTNPTCDR